MSFLLVLDQNVLESIKCHQKVIIIIINTAINLIIYDGRLAS